MKDNYVLLIEDWADDVQLLRFFFKRLKVQNPIVDVADGNMAIDYLSGKGAYGDRTKHPIPAVIFLDIKLPTLSGFEVLRWIRSRPGLSKIPVIMLTASEKLSDVDQSYRLGATSYLVKTQDEKKFRSMLQDINEHILKQQYPDSLLLFS